MPWLGDQWPVLRPGERGATFDGPQNPICVHDPQEVMRYDRVLLGCGRGCGGGSVLSGLLAGAKRLFSSFESTSEVKGGGGGGRRGGGGPAAQIQAAWVCSKIDLLGTEAIDETGLRPSDHFGLVFDAAVKAAGCEGECSAEAAT